VVPGKRFLARVWLTKHLELLDKRALAGLNRDKARQRQVKGWGVDQGLVSKVLYQHWFIANANYKSEELLRLPDYE
jgi:hypothetical protein